MPPAPDLVIPKQPKLVPVSLSIAATDDDRQQILASLVRESSNTGLHLDTNKFRQCPSLESKQIFRNDLLRSLRELWNDTITELAFIELVKELESQGCAVLAGLINVGSFQALIEEFSKTMHEGGSHAFLHSFMNLADHPNFLRDREYNHAFVHPLLVALMAYMMGGPVRVTDVRGKDTHPISVNAQDNMLHIDNTPFREEYKVLVGWEKGLPKGPTGQNFTYLPGTHKGNRHIRLDENGRPWSTENESIFVTDDTIDKVFALQKKVTGEGPTVVEVSHPEQPISAVFIAGSLVHHRYRTPSGSSRSCIIAAFHLSADNPGSLLPDSGKFTDTECLSDFVFGYQNASSMLRFKQLLLKEASQIKSKISEIFSPLSDATLVKGKHLTLSGEALRSWRETVVNAPSTTAIKLGRNNFLYDARNSISKEQLVNKLAAVMGYDKHGLLDLILYQDGHEEARKPARKLIWTMKQKDLARNLGTWLPAIVGYKFRIDDVVEPELLRYKANTVANLVREELDAKETSDNNPDTQRYIMLHAFDQLLVDLGESVTRCEKVETYIVTNLFLFWTINQVLPMLKWSARTEAILNAVVFLRAYIASVLMVEQIQT
ncbi:hypothetical protein VE03_01422 [Pseudogymnoascus sp. 23342-1-I1]|nr:hypothetical protein VE03_01422 [Pseudogymnoascus sp. 23342-1-I1]